MAHDARAQQLLPLLVRRHEHGWMIESRHGTSDGVVAYARCVDCGARRVELEPGAVAPPTPTSVVLGA